MSQTQEIVKICGLISNVANEVALYEIDNYMPIINNTKCFRSTTHLSLFKDIKNAQKRYDCYLNSLLDSNEKKVNMAEFNEIYDDFLPSYVERVRACVEKAYYKAKIKNAKLLASTQILDFMCQFACFTNDELIRLFHTEIEVRKISTLRITNIASCVKKLYDFIFKVNDNKLPLKWNIMSHPGVTEAKDALFKALLDENKFMEAWDILKIKNNE